MSVQNPTEVAEYLKSFEGKLLPIPVFNAIAETMALPYVELVIFNANARHEDQVLMSKREVDDPYFPNLWHIPGTMLRASDVTFRGNDLGVAIKRLLDDELQWLEITHLTFTGYHFHKVARGVGLSLIHIALTSGTPSVGQFFGVSHLPNDMIPEQAQFIHEAVRNKPWRRQIH